MKILSRMKELPMGWELKRDRTMNAGPVRNALAEIEMFT
jgi:hypothetical protein